MTRRALLVIAIGFALLCASDHLTERQGDAVADVMPWAVGAVAVAAIWWTTRKEHNGKL